MFELHPSSVLREHFRSKPHQGADPQKATFLFVGLDANYAADIDQNPVFASLIEYHEDGPAFWRKHRIHHPFLLPQYSGDGRRYHRTFAKIGFLPKHAHQVSFMEVMHVPTVGRNKLTPADLNNAHIQTLRKAMFDGSAQFIFVSAGVQRLLGATGAFPELASLQRHLDGLRVLHYGEGRAVFLHLHFSNYGKFEQQLQEEAKAIASLLARSDA